MAHKKPLLGIMGTAILIAILVLVYLCSPSLRLWLHPVHPDQVQTTERVSIKRYDNDWFDAARAGRTDILSALHHAGYPLDRQNHAGYTAVILSAYDNQPQALEYLLDAGANACLGDSNGNTALMGAIYKGYNATAKRLLAAHCPLEQRNNAGETAVAFAALFGRTDILLALANEGADLNARDARGQTPIMIADAQGNQAMASLLKRLMGQHHAQLEGSSRD